MKIWITKYALALGIGEAEARQVGEWMEVDGMITWADGSMEEPWEPFAHKGVSWHATREEAANRVREMADDQIAQHRKAIDQLLATISRLSDEQKPRDAIACVYPSEAQMARNL
jgi:hypothetical protein